MKNLWNAVDRLNISRVAKYELTIWILAAAGGLLGSAAGGLLMCFSLDWVWCAVLALAGAELSIPLIFFYSFRHDYHTGRCLREEHNPGTSACPAEAV